MHERAPFHAPKILSGDRLPSQKLKCKTRYERFDCSPTRGRNPQGLHGTRAVCVGSRLLHIIYIGHLNFREPATRTRGGGGGVYHCKGGKGGSAYLEDSEDRRTPTSVAAGRGRPAAADLGAAWACPGRRQTAKSPRL